MIKMEVQKSYRSWTLSIEFWDKIQTLIPTYQRDANKEYKRKAGGGRKPPCYRKILEGIFYVLRTGCQWKAIPEEFGKGSNITDIFSFGNGPVSLKRSGHTPWKNTTISKVLTGNGKALTDA
jgi:transposase